MRYRNGGIALFASLLLSGFVVTHDASAVRVTSATCTTALHVSRSATAIEISTPLPGDCVGVDPLGLGSSSLSASLGPVLPFQAFDCTQAVARGPASIDLEFGDFARHIDGVDFSLEIAGGVATVNLLRITASDGIITGGGSFVQTQNSAASCVSGDEELRFFGDLVVSMPDDSL